jgi:hypothetical protein
MKAEEIKAIADEVNQANLDKAESDINHVQIQILEAAKNGNYGLDYSFIPETDYSVVNEIRNHLLALSFIVEISDGPKLGGNSYVLTIDWSINQ